MQQLLPASASGLVNEDMMYNVCWAQLDNWSMQNLVQLWVNVLCYIVYIRLLVHMP